MAYEEAILDYLEISGGMRGKGRDWLREMGCLCHRLLFDMVIQQIHASSVVNGL